MPASSLISLLDCVNRTDSLLASGSGFISFLGSYNIFIAPICGVSQPPIHPHAISPTNLRRSLDHHRRLLLHQKRQHPHPVFVQPIRRQFVLRNQRLESQSSVRVGIRRSPGSPRLDRRLPSILGLRGCETPLPDRVGGLFRGSDGRVLRALPCLPSTSPPNRHSRRLENVF